MMKLYIYDHCPYCVKARMIFGFKAAPVKLITLLNDDEKKPISMIGAKMVPILEFQKGKFMPESMDIVSYIDKQKGKALVSPNKTDKKLQSWLDKNSGLCYELAMPRWVQAPLKEFKTSGARKYFQKKKENYIGPFEEALNNTKELIKEAEEELQELESFFDKKQSFFEEEEGLSFSDFHLFPFLRSLSIVKGLKFPPNVKHYSRQISQSSKIPLHHSIAL